MTNRRTAVAILLLVIQLLYGNITSDRAMQMAHCISDTLSMVILTFECVGVCVFVRVHAYVCVHVCACVLVMDVCCVYVIVVPLQGPDYVEK